MHVPFIEVKETEPPFDFKMTLESLISKSGLVSHPSILPTFRPGWLSLDGSPTPPALEKCVSGALAIFKGLHLYQLEGCQPLCQIRVNITLSRLLSRFCLPWNLLQDISWWLQILFMVSDLEGSDFSPLIFQPFPKIPLLPSFVQVWLQMLFHVQLPLWTTGFLAYTYCWDMACKCQGWTVKSRCRVSWCSLVMDSYLQLFSFYRMEIEVSGGFLV